MATADISAYYDEILRTLEERTASGIWLWKCSTRSLHWSDGMFRLFGLSHTGKEPSYALVHQMTHPDDRLPHGEFDRLIEDSGKIRREYRVIWPDGRVRWLRSEADVIYANDGTPLRVIGIAFDITERHEMAHRRKLSEQRLRALIQIADSIVFTARPNADIVDVNNVDDAVAMNPEQYTARSWEQFIHPEDLARVHAAMKAAKENNKSLHVEHRIRMLDGTYRWRRTRAAPVHDSDNVVREYIGFSKDIEAKVRAKISLAGVAMTGAQLRAARGISNLSVRELSERASVSVATIRRIEESDRAVEGHETDTKALRDTLEKAGVEFFESDSGKPGVRPA